jgi:putative peptide zinc metalloprotease protein
VTPNHPAILVVPGENGQPATEFVLTDGSGTSAATAFPFHLPAAPGPGDTQALAIGTRDGGVTYDVAYTLVTVSNGAPVTNTNSAYALAHCNACTTVAVSFQVVLIIGQSNVVTPENAAVALNYDCPACSTTAIAEQMVVTLKAQATDHLVEELEQTLSQLNALQALGSHGDPAIIAADVAAIQQQIQDELDQSGLVSSSPGPASTPSGPGSGTSPTPFATPDGSSAPPAATATPVATAAAPSATAAATP